MQNRTQLVGGALPQRIRSALRTHRAWLELISAVVAGYVMAGSSLFGGVAPFGVAFCASLKRRYSICAALGAVLGYVVSPDPLANLKYLAAVVVVVAVVWLFGGRLGDKYFTAAAAATAFVALAVSSAAVLITTNATLYDVVLGAAESCLGGGAAYFFARTVKALELGWQSLNRSDASCAIVSFAIVIMGFAGFGVAGISLGRVLSVIVILLCARTGDEAGGAVAGITAGIAMGLSGGDYAYVISAYGFGGLVAGVFGNLGRIACAGSFIVINTIAALFTQTSAEVYHSIIEIFIASVVFVLIPQGAVARVKLNQVGKGADPAYSPQTALRDRLLDVSSTLRDISETTKKVSDRLGQMESTDLTDIYNRVAERACSHCGMKTTCWKFKYTETMKAMNDAFATLKKQGSINRERLPKYFVENCCRLEDFLYELNIQFRDQISREGVQMKVAKVRSVLTEQFDGMAMLMEELSGEVCGVRLLDPQKTRRVRDYFERQGITVQHIWCYNDQFDRISVELNIPSYQEARLKKTKSALDLCALLDCDFDQPHVTVREQHATVTYTEKATYTVEMGAYQLSCGKNKLCGDAYESIHNQNGRAHFILSDGMGSGGSAAVDSKMAAGLLSRLISVGLSHESSLKMVNSALLIKSGEESLATIDICTLDLYTGRVDFYKAGAAPTFLMKNGRASFMQSSSLPAGILQGVAFEKSGTALHEGDVVVMVSDGVIATGTEWVISEMETSRSADMQRLCEKLAMTAKIRRTDGHEDDITVLAMALRKGA